MWRSRSVQIRLGLIGVLAVVGVSAIFASLASTNRLPPTTIYWQIAMLSSHGGPSELYILDPDTRAMRSLTPGIGYVRQPVWSPDGQRLAFVADSIGVMNSDVYVVNADGTGLTNLTPFGDTSYEETPAWSSDGTQVAFMRWNSTDNNADIFVVDADSSNMQQITNSPDWEAMPVWIPQTDRIAFIVSTAAWEVHTINADGTDRDVFIQSPGNDNQLTWSPDGSQVAFVSTRDGIDEIYLLNADGSNLRRLTHNSEMETMPAWSPDGRQLAFVSGRDGNFEVYTMNADGSNQRRITNNDAADVYPQWSPDGSQVVFALERRYVGRFAATGNCGIFAADLQRGLITQLTGSEEGICDTFPQWRPS